MKRNTIDKFLTASTELNNIHPYHLIILTSFFLTTHYSFALPLTLPSLHPHYPKFSYIPFIAKKGGERIVGWGEGGEREGGEGVRGVGESKGVVEVSLGVVKTGRVKGIRCN